MSNDCISIYTTLWAYNIYSAMSRDEFCKELDLLCKVRDSYINDLPDSLVLEYLDNVYTIMTDVLVEQALQEKDAQ